MKHRLLNIGKEHSLHIVEVVFWIHFWGVDMYPVSALMQGIFSFNIVEYFSNAYSISSSYNSCFIKLIFIFSQRFLRTNKERIRAIIQSFICVAAPRSNIGNFRKCPPYNVTCPPPCGRRRSAIYHDSIRTVSSLRSVPLLAVLPVPLYAL